MDINSGLYRCNSCSKFYSSYKSLWNHNKKFHNNNNLNDNKIQINDNIYDNKMTTLLNKIDDNNLKCKYCNKLFSHRNSRWFHEKTCKQKEEIITINKTEFNNIKKQLEDNNKLKLEIQEIKNKLKNRNITNNTTNNINNGTIINNTFVKFPQVLYRKLLNNKQIMYILNQQCGSLEASVKMINLNDEALIDLQSKSIMRPQSHIIEFENQILLGADKHPENQNIYITNLRDNNAHIFNGKEFVTVNRKEAISRLIDSHIYEITEAFEEYGCKLSEYAQKSLKSFLNDIVDETTKYTDCNNIQYKNYKAYKIETLTKEIYNKSDKNKLSQLKAQELNEKLLDTELSEE